MSKKMKLSSKMYLGFATVVIVAAILGFVGWNGTTKVRKQMAVYAEWGNIDMVMNEDVTQKVLLLDNAFGVYRASPDESAMNTLQTAMTEASQGVEGWAALVKDYPELVKAAEDVGEHLKLYSDTLSQYQSSLSAQTTIRTQWDSIVADCLSLLETTMEDVIDPAKEAAEQAKDVPQMVRWGAIDMLMNEAVIANVLKLQTAAHDYAAAGTESAWNVFLQASQDATQGLADWREVIAGEAKVEASATKIESYLSDFAKSGNAYHTQAGVVQGLESSVTTSAQGVFQKLEDAMENVIDPAKESAVNRAQRTQTVASTAALCLTIAGIAVGSLLAYFVTRSIVKPINRIILALTEGSEQVTAASNQVSAASQSLAEGSTEQAAGLEETSSSLEEMSSMTKQNADNAQQANTLANEARKAADTGTDSMARMNEAIEEIQKSSDETAKIIKVIDEIAFQTNLLALNAAVEAARAGEAGKGFAVVAEEVRNLAMRSAEAAKNTANMIEESVKNSKNGVDIAGEVGKVLDEIVQGVGKTTDLVSEIAAASQEQAQGIDQVNTAVAQMDKVTQQNAANAEESASASEELNAQSEAMNEIVQQLVALVGGTSVRSGKAGTGIGNNKNVKVDHESAKKAHELLMRNHVLGKSDQAFHQIAGGSGEAPKRRKATVKSGAESVIPLDGEEGLENFNS
jgi:methyl-accepting chemotaxis protein